MPSKVVEGMVRMVTGVCANALTSLAETPGGKLTFQLQVGSAPPMLLEVSHSMARCSGACAGLSKFSIHPRP
jgi:hypothetical protein